ncbi:MAG: Piwi domain-containing protein [Candidatus Heimdallarchaeota archaeon]
MKIFYVPEPELFFRNGNKCADPKVGLLNFGPSGLPTDNYEIEIGLVGTKSSNKTTKEFMNRLEYDIPGEKFPNSNVRGISFPGVDVNRPLGFYFTIRDEFCEEISSDVISLMKEDNSRRAKVVRAADAYYQALQDLSGVHPKPRMVIISLPKEIIHECKDPHIQSNNIKLFGRTYEELSQIAKLPEDERPLLFDFHHFLKAKGHELNLHTQIVKPSTLEFKSTQEDPATIAWNFCSAAFYKSTGTPWKLADLDPETIHVGISFYRDIGDEGSPVVRASIAQVYMRTGDSQVIRSLEIPITRFEDTRPNLTEEQSKEVLEKAIMLYERKHDNQRPFRVVVHKKSEYTISEESGFHQAAEGIEIQDYLHIQKETDFRALPSSEYPMMRGSIFDVSTSAKTEFYIYTTGYIPCLATYPGNTVPSPLKVLVNEAASPVDRLAVDIMHLTKLDWNTASFAKKLPVTVSVSEKVGEILGEFKLNRSSPPTAYSYYM